ncbi:regulatory protein RecX [Marinicella meishanensis]|uniref:regulatory protein RecX n=1 Tax=Marinicella meishanensis TaxID=2873263 RepID=UPI001CBBD553|nr:regulatory protein RecX [Marinicella sp. NBU2979]
MAESAQHTPEARARASAVASLAMREHSCEELRQKLLNKNHDAAVVEGLLADLVADNLLSDQRFAEAYWRLRSSRGYGPERIAKELQIKGVADHQIKQSRAAEDIDFMAVIAQVYEKKYRGKPCADLKEIAKRQGFLFRRGFGMDLIRTVMD